MARNYWMNWVKLEGGVGLELLIKHNTLNIGFKELTNLDPAESDKIRKEAEKLYEAGDEGFERFNSSWRGSLGRFLSMQVGDWVVVPTPKEEDTFFIYEIASRCMNKASLKSDEVRTWVAEKDFGFFYQVEPVVKGVSRIKYLSEALNSLLENRQTTLDLNEFGKDIEDMVKSIQESE